MDILGLFLNVQNLTKKSVFSVSILSVKVKIVDDRKKQTTYIKKKLIMFICKIWLKSETINKLVC